MRRVLRSALLVLVAILLLTKIDEAQIARWRMVPEYVCSGTTIALGDDWQTASTNGSNGTVFCIAAGTHRLQTLEPKQDQQFISTAGAVMSGAKLLTSPSGSNPWTYSSQTQASAGSGGTCATTEPMCQDSRDVFIDSVRQHHVATLGEVTTGTWFINDTTHVLSLGSDPSGHTVEASITPASFVSEGGIITGVRIRGLIIEKYATDGGKGTISAPNGQGWKVERNVVRSNHSTGIAVGVNGQVLNNVVYKNGLNGIGAYDATNLIIRGNESYQNGNLFDPYWGAAGMKVAYIRNSLIYQNYVHGNYGGGIWCDIDCDGVTIANNYLLQNDQFGIQYEISWNGSIHHNTLTQNGRNDPSFGPSQAGIFISSSNTVDIYANTLLDNVYGVVGWEAARGTSPSHGTDWSLENMTVHDNTICTLAGGSEGNLSVSGFTDDTYYTSRGNSFVRNVYKGLSTGSFYWLDGTRTFAVWQGTYSQDTAGSRSVSATCP